MTNRCECQLTEYLENLPCPKCEGGPSPEDICDTTMQVRRYKTRTSWLLSGRSAAGATIVGILGALLTFVLAPEGEAWRTNLMAAFSSTFFVGLAIFNFRSQLSTSSAKLFWGHVAEMEEDRKVRLSLPSASCPWCDELMTVRRFFPRGGHLDVWVCMSGEREHRPPFDLNKFIEIAE